MRICIVAEGSYPYVTGGVSSWIQMLVENMPEHEFIIYAIGAYEKNRGKFKYTLPENIIEVKEIFLDAYLNDIGVWGKKLILNEQEREMMVNLSAGEKFDWGNLFSFVENLDNMSVSDFLMSKEFFDIVSEVSEKYFSYITFNDFFWTVRSMLLALLEVLKNDVPKADIYHAVSTGYAGVVASLGKYKYKVPLILTEHGIYTREREEEIIKADWVKGYFKENWIKYFYNLSRCIYMDSDEIITLFEKNKKIQIEIGCDENKISVIPNGVNSNDFLNIDKGKIDENIIAIGSILRVVPIKDVKTIIQGFSIACEKNKNLSLYIIGPEDEDPMYSEECKSLVESLELDNVVFTGRVDVKDYIGKMDILILGSISEGQPLAVLEGMAASKPHVVTDVGSCRELMEGVNDEYGNAGIVVSVMDYEALGEAMVRLSINKELREQMGKNAFKRVSKLYTIDNFINKYKKIYSRAVIN